MEEYSNTLIEGKADNFIIAALRILHHYNSIRRYVADISSNTEKMLQTDASEISQQSEI